jgi:hypothetical protein
MKLIVTVATCGVAVLLVSSVQSATATEHHHARKAHHVCAVPRPVWDSNASIAAPVAPAASLPSYYSGGWSAPAGH